MGTLPPTLDALLPGVEIGLIREVIVIDGGSEDGTRELAADAGARVITSPLGRGQQLSRGAEAARSEWMFFLHADTQPAPDWAAAVAHHIQTAPEAGVFELKFRASGLTPSLVAGWANLRTRLFKLPYGDQGLLISKSLYFEIGGYPGQALMEDVAIARALMGRFRILPVTASTSAEKYISDGWAKRGARNLTMLVRYLLGADPDTLAQRYHKR